MESWCVSSRHDDATEQGSGPCARRPARAPHGDPAHQTTWIVRAENFEDDMTVHLAPPLEKLLAELAADPWLNDVAAPFRTALKATELEADDNWHAGEMLRCFGLIAEQPRPLRDRITDIFEILSMPKGRITVTIRRAS
jgi:hypothetical protein